MTVTAVTDRDEFAGPIWIDRVDDLERLFRADGELVRFACVLSEARNMVMGGCVPRALRRDLAPLVDGLERLLRTPHLQAAQPRASR